MKFMFSESIIHAASNVGISLNQNQILELDIHCRLLEEWNRRMNLTSIRDPEEILRRHFLEGLMAGDLLRKHEAEGTLLDLGSGNGFPAITLQTMLPALHPLTLIESSSKKAAFLRTLLRELEREDSRVVVRHVRSGSDLMDLPSRVFTTRGVRPFNLIAAGLPFLVNHGLVLLFHKLDVLEKEVPSFGQHFLVRDEVKLENRETGILLLEKK
jgi:16S rRNA (guanine527-N7)-methyltransferase